MVMVFHQFEPILVNLDKRSGQGQVKVIQGQSFKLLILKNKDVF